MRDQDLFLERALVGSGLVDRAQMDAARRYAAEHQLDLVDALVESKTISGRAVALTRASVSEVLFVELSDYETSFANARFVPRAIAERFCIFPLFVIDGLLTLAMDDPLSLEALDQVREIAKCDVEPVLCERTRLRELIARAYSLNAGDVEETTADSAIERELDDTQPVIAAVNQMLADAADQGASDLHINPDEQHLRLRLRIDGELLEGQGPPRSMHASIVQRLKVMANLDLTLTRRPQDGKFRFAHRGEKIEVRMSTVPTVCGENVVLRLLGRARSIPDFKTLGVPSPMIAALEEMLTQPYGMILVTGPTGSGKTTTLYTAINRINHPARNIMTIEDPVEIRLPYVRQIQVHPEIGLTFATALRSILRQDPDVVLVGEVRDEETATIAMQAALTGHLVLSTLHTNDAAGAVSRLRDLRLPSFVINSAVLGALAQRLVRRVCSQCATPVMLDDVMRRRFGLDERENGFTRGAGCGRCRQTGYRGRVGIYELLPFTTRIQAAIEPDGSVSEIRAVAVQEGMRLMWQDGLDKARHGQTTLEEVARVAAIVTGDAHATKSRFAA
jgi:type IV pilus assembly protein PilB